MRTVALILQGTVPDEVPLATLHEALALFRDMLALSGVVLTGRLLSVDDAVADGAPYLVATIRDRSGAELEEWIS